MPIVADTVDAVIGVDTHVDTHTLALCSPAGALLAQATYPTDPAGLAAAIEWATAQAPGLRVVFAVEGTRSYGIGLTRLLQTGGHTVIEVEQPTRTARRGRGKSDHIDAALAARTALGYDTDKLPTPRAEGTREALRILLVARNDLSTERTAKLNALRALLRSGTPTEHALAGQRFSDTVLTGIARRRARPDEDLAAATRRAETRRLALRIRALDTELKTNRGALIAGVTSIEPGLLDHTGIGPVSAAQILISWSHPGRCRSEAAFAALAGVNPLEASSGKNTRHRLNRGGDRQLNRALHDIAKTRMIHDPETRAYLQRRRTEGRTDREIRRCLKRYLARRIHRHLTRTLDNT